MIIYIVKYKKINSLFWEKIKKVKGDFCYRDEIQTDQGWKPLMSIPVRVFILEDETRIEIPMLNYIFKFSKERFFSIKERMEIEARQNIQINPK